MQTTVGQALASEGVRLQDGDWVSPPANQVLSPGAHVYVSHVVPVSLVVAGEEQQVRTHGRTVGDVLAQAGVSLQGEDYVSPGASTSVRGGMAISVTTVPSSDWLTISSVPPISSARSRIPTSP